MKIVNAMNYTWFTFSHNVSCFFQNFAVEIRADDLGELDYETVKSEVEKAGGANYGTGTRE